MKLAIKIDVDTYRGTLVGVPKLVEILKRRGIPATFLFSFGPDNTGKSLCRIFKKGFLKKCLRSNVAGNYGLKTLLYGTLLPAPVIYKKCAPQIKAAGESGFECGIHSWDHFKWQNRLSNMRPTEIEAEFTKASVEFEKIFGRKPESCGAPGWQVSPDSLDVQDAAGLTYASDVRGTSPFFPSMGGRNFKTLQIPSTLPTLDEMLGLFKLEDVASLHFKAMEDRQYSVMTIHAELEGMAYAEWFESFIVDAKLRGVEFYSLKDRARELLNSRDSIPRFEVKMLPFPGRSGLLAQQSGGEL